MHPIRGRVFYLKDAYVWHLLAKQMGSTFGKKFEILKKCGKLEAKKKSKVPFAGVGANGWGIYNRSSHQKRELWMELSIACFGRTSWVNLRWFYALYFRNGVVSHHFFMSKYCRSI